MTAGAGEGNPTWPQLLDDRPQNMQRACARRLLAPEGAHQLAALPLVLPPRQLDYDLALFGINPNH